MPISLTGYWGGANFVITGSEFGSLCGTVLLKLGWSIPGRFGKVRG